MQIYNGTKSKRIGFKRRNDSRASSGRFLGEPGQIAGLFEVENKLLEAC
jgi:hypothetical protein